MTIPYRGVTGNGTHFITSATYQKVSIFQTDRMAGLFLQVPRNYRDQNKYRLHEFVLMPHFRMFLTSTITREKAVQFIKGSVPSQERTRVLWGNPGTEFL